MHSKENIGHRGRPRHQRKSVSTIGVIAVQNHEAHGGLK